MSPASAVSASASAADKKATIITTTSATPSPPTPRRPPSARVNAYPHTAFHHESLRDPLFAPVSVSASPSRSRRSSPAPDGGAFSADSKLSRPTSRPREYESDYGSQRKHGRDSSENGGGEGNQDGISNAGQIDGRTGKRSRIEGTDLGREGRTRARVKTKITTRRTTTMGQEGRDEDEVAEDQPQKNEGTTARSYQQSIKIKAPPGPKTMDPPVLSFYGAKPVPLPSRFAQVKRRLVQGHGDALRASWIRLLTALADEARTVQKLGPALIPSIEFARIDDAEAVAPFRAALRSFGVGVIRGVVPATDAAAWLAETQAYLGPEDEDRDGDRARNRDQNRVEVDGHNLAQDPLCLDFFWTPAQVRARAHPGVLRAMKFAMRFWTTPAPGDAAVAARFPIAYADRIRVHGDDNGGGGSGGDGKPVEASQPPPLMAQVDGGSLERWEPDGYGRGGTYDAIFRGAWEQYDPWDPSGRVQATPDLYNGAGACSIFRMFQGLLALTDVTPGMVQLLASPQLATAYFLLRPFFRAKKGPPGDDTDDAAAAMDAFLAAENWEFEEEPSTIIHGAVPGHAQRITELWHPHLQLRKNLVTPPSLRAGDYVVWHCDTAYRIGPVETEGGATKMETSLPSSSPPKAGPETLVYLPACPLTQTNALYLARQRKAFLRGHPGPDFDSTGSGLGSEADHAARLSRDDIAAVGGLEGLRAMGLEPWEGEGEEREQKRNHENEIDEGEARLSKAELELVRLANIILFPDKYEFFMPTRHNSPDR